MELARCGAASLDRDVEQAIIALKKGSQLLKYGRRGRPKFAPFRLSNDETTLIWFSGRKERQLRLDAVTKIIPGQRTANFQRYPRPEKEYQSFSLIYGSGGEERSLDLICKDKDEAEVWFVGLKARVSSNRTLKVDNKSEGTLSDVNSPLGRALRDSPLNSYDSFNRSPYGSPSLFKTASTGELQSVESAKSDSLASEESLNAQGRSVSLADAFRVSMSSAVSSSSQGSGPEDSDALGDVFIWGEGAGEGFLGGGVCKLTSGAGSRVDSLVPKALQAAVVLDVSSIACGSRHAALVTKQGDVFCWGEEYGGRLGHGIDVDVSEPQLVQALAGVNTELVACGDFHTCAVTLSGELYTWGADAQSGGLVGHSNPVSHWMPKRMSSPLEGVRISSIACGAWHTALVSSAGQLFTFGDGTFGVLGHGDKRNLAIPKEVESLKGLKTVRAACGIWHTAAVVEVIVGYSSATSCSSGKLFTWGDGDKYRLGHGDKEQKLVPTCVAALVDYNFRQVACGHSLTVALTTSGRVFTMGSTIYGQLGNPKADGKVPGMVDGELARTFVEEIGCGAHHVAALSSKTEIYTWGKGANGRLGHGDVEDRTAPTLVEALRDKQVKTVACGSSFTAVICLHKPVSDADQSVCSGCKQAFGFTRKRHNCYNCGLAYCHSCSSKKAFRASLAPNPSKAYRVCEPCLAKLERSASEEVARKSRKYMDGRERPLIRASKPIEMKQVGYYGNSRNTDDFAAKHQTVINIPTAIPERKAVSAKPSPPRSATPTPTSAGLAPPGNGPDELQKKLELSRQEVLHLKTQVRAWYTFAFCFLASNHNLILSPEQISTLTSKYEQRERELRRGAQKVQEAVLLAGEETAKCRAAKEVIKSLTVELKELAERMPSARRQQQRQEVPNGRHFPAPEAEIDLRLQTSPTSSNSATDTTVDKLVLGSGPEEWVEQDQAGVYITLALAPGGGRDLKRVRFSRRRFSEKEAEQWWQDNRVRVHQQYSIIRTSNTSKNPT
ncbi:PH, RCC1 and FYVE domains-containing protein 1 isoform X2 [Selaginella moellendorffii]|uniref:PH, RCC1 and FYVE domains-containing protein 1 isoform X2 n=1 Tax=Selaginella moellendorffii TaxID=88036 RepID=UPI000D1C6F45|nr:PH, RCC1 and FYVE domains-containing protein 1 isoform X2 [Selaginella moellendorffii]|eukprot:XP_024522134.1 PH, RCC1 and FYVE domains-containing protein 1 isoform X2 [Selaginella moellendorffii]